MNGQSWSFSVRQLVIPKKGNSPLECEDAVGVNMSKLRFCVADGATEGFDSRRWARTLVKHWTAAVLPITTSERFEHWVNLVGERFKKRWEGQQLSWYAQEKAECGAFAAFIGLSFCEKQEHLFWHAIGLGDSCLFVRRADQMVKSLPIDDPANFGNAPFLVASNPAVHREQACAVFSDTVQSGDRFLLLTDAMAAWYLRSFRTEPTEALNFEELLAKGCDDEVRQLVTQRRIDGVLKNDDVAAMLISTEKS